MFNRVVRLGTRCAPSWLELRIRKALMQSTLFLLRCQCPRLLQDPFTDAQRRGMLEEAAQHSCGAGLPRHIYAGGSVAQQ
ncbi:MAG: hypothetical protein KatS3mg132_466 [Limisphaera sp.]|nr:MAG: hypothetical protein KatS3mg132_466 [Limisphaera sp.]